MFDLQGPLFFKISYWNSRRLREAWEHIQEEVKKFRSRANDGLTVQACEGDQALYRDILNRLHTAADSLLLRFKYLGTFPWNFANVDTVGGAQEFLRCARAKPSSEEDPLTSYLLAKHEAELHGR